MFGSRRPGPLACASGLVRLSRRELLERASTGFGLTALAGLMAESGALGAPAPLARTIWPPDLARSYSSARRRAW